MSRYDIGFLNVFWGADDPRGRKKHPLRPRGGPGQPAARRFKFSAAAALTIIIFASEGREIEFEFGNGFPPVFVAFYQFSAIFSLFFRVFRVFLRLFSSGTSKNTLLAPR